MTRKERAQELLRRGYRYETIMRMTHLSEPVIARIDNEAVEQARKPKRRRHKFHLHASISSRRRHVEQRKQRIMQAATNDGHFQTASSPVRSKPRVVARRQYEQAEV